MYKFNSSDIEIVTQRALRFLFYQFIKKVNSHQNLIAALTKLYWLNYLS